MTHQAIVLYGPPASGKDTISNALSAFNSKYRLFRRLKVGPGRTNGYRLTTHEHLQMLRSTGLILWENARYNAIYAVDRPGLEECIEAGVAVVHLGQAAAVRAVIDGVPDVSWRVIELRCPRDVALKRIINRATGDTAARMQAWDATPSLNHADLVIDTSAITPPEAARQIDASTRGSAVQG